MEASPQRLVIAMTGASMPQLGIKLLQTAVDAGVETHLVISMGARRTIALEAPDWTVGRLHEMSTVSYHPDDLAAAIASGSFRTDGMVVIPCSMNAVASIAYSLADNLLTRAADVTLKESRPLVLVPRESPLHLGHLRNLTRAAEIGAKVVPPVVGAYYGPQTIDDVTEHIVGRVLDQVGIKHDLVRRWTGATPEGQMT